MLERVWSKRNCPPLPVGENVSKCSHCEEQSGGSLKTKSHVIQWAPSWAYVRKRRKLYLEDARTPVLIATLFIVGKTWKHLNKTKKIVFCIL